MRIATGMWYDTVCMANVIRVGKQNSSKTYLGMGKSSMFSRQTLQVS